METVFPIFFIALVVVALVCWVFAIQAIFGVMRMSPPADKFGNYVRVGLWQFGEIERRLGPGVRPLLTRYRNAFFAFFICILIAIAASFLAAGISQ